VAGGGETWLFDKGWVVISGLAGRLREAQVTRKSRQQKSRQDGKGLKTHGDDVRVRVATNCYGAFGQDQDELPEIFGNLLD
jgi:hypothetical protein